MPAESSADNLRARSDGRSGCNSRFVLSLFVYFDHKMSSSPEKSDEPLRHHAVRGRGDEWLRT